MASAGVRPVWGMLMALVRGSGVFFITVYCTPSVHGMILYNDEILALQANGIGKARLSPVRKVEEILRS